MQMQPWPLTVLENGAMKKALTVSGIAKNAAIALPVAALIAGVAYMQFQIVQACELGSRTAAAAACLTGDASGIHCSDLMNEGFTKQDSGWTKALQFDSARQCNAFVRTYSSAPLAAVVASSATLAGSVVKSPHGEVMLSTVESLCRDLQSHATFEITVPFEASPHDDALARLYRKR